MQKHSHFFSKNISVYAIFNDQSFNDMLANDIVSFEQLGPGQFSAISYKGDNFCDFLFTFLHTCKKTTPSGRGLV